MRSVFYLYWNNPNGSPVSPNVDAAIQKRLAEIIESDSELGDAIYADGSSREEARWYNCDRDMAGISQEFQDVLFVLYVTTLDDHSIVYYLNGLMQEGRGKIVYPPFDPSKLQPYKPYSYTPLFQK